MIPELDLGKIETIMPEKVELPQFPEVACKNWPFDQAEARKLHHEPRGPWPVGLAVADKLSGPWKRMPEDFNPVPIVETFAENPVVSTLPDGRYLAVFDSLGPREIGYSISKDGLAWSPETRLAVQTGKNLWAGTNDHDMRTPLCAIREEDGTFTVIYTAHNKSMGFSAVGKCTLGWAAK